METYTLLSFLGATALVAVLTYLIVGRMQRSTNVTEEFFTGGRSLSWGVVAGSLLLTNISTEQLVGLNGNVFKDGNLVGIAWEALAAFAMIATALLFLPRYLASGFTTTTAFLEERFDRQTRQIVAGLFLLGYIMVLLPTVLYTGALAMQSIFGVSYPLWTVITAIGLIGSAYAIFGGLKSVAVSDTINGVGLLIGGLAIPFFALQALGDGSVAQGLSTLVGDRPEYLTPLAMLDRRGGETSVPWTTLLTGMMFIQVFYWSTNQVVVQRALGARNLAEGQKGVLFASLMKLVGPLMLCLPGIIALHMLNDLSLTIDPADLKDKLTASNLANSGLADAVTYAQTLVSQHTESFSLSLADADRLAPLGIVNDRVYPVMIRYVITSPVMLGLFAAVIFGSILSSFNSALNSASTLFCLEFYEHQCPPAEGEQAEQERAHHIVSVGQYFGISLAVLAVLIAPQLSRMETIFEYLQKANGVFSVPVISIFLVGILTKSAPAKGAKIAIVSGVLVYTMFTFWTLIFGSEPIMHWLHGYAISFAVAVGTLLISGMIAPRSAEEMSGGELREAPVDMTPWSMAVPASIVIVALTIIMYIALYILAK
jgi:SSS family solute:Na+ symporter